MAKIRTGFVSNSSSSSFIVRNKEKFEHMKQLLEEVGGDYYIMDDVMYTSCISDCTDIFNDIYDLADENISTAWTEPYDTTDFYELEGERGVASVWIEKDKCTDLNKIEQDKKDKLYDYVKNFIDVYEVYNGEHVSLLDALTFIDRCCEIMECKNED